MKFGITIPLHRSVEVKTNLELALRCEELGFDSIWISDHVILPNKYKGRFSDILYDPLVLLASLAASTKRINLGTSVLILPYRNPIIVAKMVSTLDMLSDGRVIFGVGPGWMKEEFDTIGIPFNDRGRRTNEYIKIFKELWNNDEPNFKGEFYNFSEIKFYPKPLQKPHPPIWIGGNSNKAIRRAIQLGDGWHPVWFGPDEMLEKINLLRKHAIDAGRSLDNFTFSIRNRLRILKKGEKMRDDSTKWRGDLTFQFYGTTQEIIKYVEQFKNIGVSHIVFDIDVRDDREMFYTLDIFLKEIMPAFKT